jgi:hypothetical protein
VLLVYAILDRRTLEAELVGPALAGVFRERAAARFKHGRG